MSHVRFHVSVANSIRMPTSDSISTSDKQKQTESKSDSQLFVPLENIILDYMDSISVVCDEYFDSAKYDPVKIGAGQLSLFQSRLAVITLLRHAVRGEYKEVDAMLTKNPLLLLEKDTIVDFSGRKHLNRTVYQLALGAKDCDVLSKKGNKVVKGMIEMIEKHFRWSGYCARIVVCTRGWRRIKTESNLFIRW